MHLADYYSNSTDFEQSDLPKFTNFVNSTNFADFTNFTDSTDFVSLNYLNKFDIINNSSDRHKVLKDLI